MTSFKDYVTYRNPTNQPRIVHHIHMPARAVDIQNPILTAAMAMAMAKDVTDAKEPKAKD